jgi:hypothetical protein
VSDYQGSNRKQRLTGVRPSVWITLSSSVILFNKYLLDTLNFRKWRLLISESNHG